MFLFQRQQPPQPGQNGQPGSVPGGPSALPPPRQPGQPAALVPQQQFLNRPIGTLTPQDQWLQTQLATLQKYHEISQKYEAMKRQQQQGKKGQPQGDPGAPVDIAAAEGLQPANIGPDPHMLVRLGGFLLTYRTVLISNATFMKLKAAFFESAITKLCSEASRKDDLLIHRHIIYCHAHCKKISLKKLFMK